MVARPNIRAAITMTGRSPLHISHNLRPVVAGFSGLGQTQAPVDCTSIWNWFSPDCAAGSPNAQKVDCTSMWNWLNPLCNMTPNPVNPSTGQPQAVDCGVMSPQNWTDPRCWASSPVSGSPTNTSTTTMMFTVLALGIGAVLLIQLLKR